jgi:chloramphenicol-sensitive protein RarD
MKQGIIYGIIAYLSWGLLPLYWRLFDTMSAWEILAHRVVWSCFLLFSLQWLESGSN